MHAPESSDQGQMVVGAALCVAPGTPAADVAVINGLRICRLTARGSVRNEIQKRSLCVSVVRAEIAEPVLLHPRPRDDPEMLWQAALDLADEVRIYAELQNRPGAG